MKYIPLTKGNLAIVDDADYAVLVLHSWHINTQGYASRTCGKYLTNAGERVLMHREILGLLRYDGQQVDHANGNKLDNRRKNLRVCDSTGNMQNKPKPNRLIGASSLYKGVHLSGGKWGALITANGIRHNIGRFATEEDAARAYDKAAKKYHGKFAKLNFPTR